MRTMTFLCLAAILLLAGCPRDPRAEPVRLEGGMFGDGTQDTRFKLEGDAAIEVMRLVLDGRVVESRKIAIHAGFEATYEDGTTANVSISNDDIVIIGGEYRSADSAKLLALLKRKTAN